MSNIILQVSGLPKTIAINNEWIMGREALLGEGSHIKKIENQEQLTKAEILLKKVTTHSNTLEKKRKEFGKPFREFDSKIKKFADRENDQLVGMKARLKEIIGRYITEQEENRVAEAEEAHERLQNNPFAQYMGASATPAPVSSEPTRMFTSVTSVWKFEVINIDDVPDAYTKRVIDTEKVNEYVRSEKDGANIPGIKIWEEKQVKSR